MRETWVQTLGWEYPLEKRTATHFSILAWRIPWTIRSMAMQTVRHDWASFTFTLGSAGGSDGKEFACSVGNLGAGRSPGEGNGNPLQHPCLEKFHGGGAWQAIVHGVAKSQTRLSNFIFFLTIARTWKELKYTLTHEWMNIWCVCVHTHNGILISHKRQRNWVICREMNEARDCLKEWS